MQNRDVIEFFDRLAPQWDAGIRRNERVIAAILDAAQVREGKRVLDVACGTGVLIGDYLNRGASLVVGVDISPKMAQLAGEKFAACPKVRILCEDAGAVTYKEPFDCILIYNAFPHFCDPKGLVSHLTGLLAFGGTLTIAHGMSREQLAAHHMGAAKNVSVSLPPARELAALLEGYVDITACVDDEQMYLVSGTLK
ncbi:MAG: class I SAM-dependent methyltransferase [Clostridia bacterium]|nr:class I SAM-dependent methyltransferase [Clostridia bacterium]